MVDNVDNKDEAAAGAESSREKRRLPSIDDLKRLKREHPCPGQPPKEPPRVWFNSALVPTAKIEVTLKVVTPILGGGYKTRHIDDVDVIRAPSVRAHLRFWWRALYAHPYGTAKELYDAERALWGGAADDGKNDESEGEGKEEKRNKKGGRSPVEVRVTDVKFGDKLMRDAGALADVFDEFEKEKGIFEQGYRRIEELHNKRMRKEKDAEKNNLEDRYKKNLYFDFRDQKIFDIKSNYALWTAGSTDDQPFPAARWKSGAITFKLSVEGPKNEQQAIRNAIRAWILFGGYGGRTRRGLGSLTVDKEAEKWLPPAFKDKKSFSQDLTRIFSGADLFSGEPKCTNIEAPVLARAKLFVGQPKKASKQNLDPDGGAWAAALDWLYEFRQGMKSGARQRPDERAVDPNRPSISNWPEADVWRRINGDRFDHPSRYAGRAYPRAGLGLPFQTRFQTRARGGGRLREPDDYTLYWHDGEKERDRFASPLIVKALPLADGSFLPCALWMTRAFPGDNARVIVKGRSPKDTGAKFDAEFKAPDGVPEFIKEAGSEGLRSAFIGWLLYDAGKQLGETIQEIAP